MGYKNKEKAIKTNWHKILLYEIKTKCLKKKRPSVHRNPRRARTGGHSFTDSLTGPASPTCYTHTPLTHIFQYLGLWCTYASIYNICLPFPAWQLPLILQVTFTGRDLVPSSRTNHWVSAYTLSAFLSWGRILILEGQIKSCFLHGALGLSQPSVSAVIPCLALDGMTSLDYFYHPTSNGC